MAKMLSEFMYFYDDSVKSEMNKSFQTYKTFSFFSNLTLYVFT